MSPPPEGQYARGTEVTPERSQAEIMGLLRRYGATGFAYGWEGATAAVQFTAHDRRVRFVLDLPVDPAPFRVHLTPAGQRRTRSPSQASAAMEAEVRRLWRALALAIKAKLEVVASGIASFEDEFMAHIVLPDGTTVADQVRPQIKRAYDFGGQHSALMLEAGRGAQPTQPNNAPRGEE